LVFKKPITNLTVEFQDDMAETQTL